MSSSRTGSSHVATKVLLPRFKASGKPFVMVFWSRDPDGTQHNEGDSLNTLTPGDQRARPASRRIRNASDDLQRLRDALAALGLDKTTDVFVTADHGFSVESPPEPDERRGEAELSRHAAGLPAGRASWPSTCPAPWA